jgi:histidine triad (HIT) family protein
MSDCIFCKIINDEIPSKKIYEDANFLAFHDAFPKANTHALIIPKKHIESLSSLEDTDTALMGELTLLLPKIAEMVGLDAGFKTIINTGKDGGQEVYHIHYHILGD